MNVNQHCPGCGANVIQAPDINQSHFCQSCGFDFDAQRKQDEVDEGFESGVGFSDHNQNATYYSGYNNQPDVEQHNTKPKTHQISHYDNEQPKPLKNRTVAGFLGIFFGFLGVHHFYVGYTGRGIFLLAMSAIIFRVFYFLPILYIIPIVWGIVEGILILVGKLAVTDPYGRPLE